MGDMGIGHNEVVISHPCNAASMRCSPVHCYIFFYGVVITNNKECVFFFV